jgi:hypothetical protein
MRWLVFSRQSTAGVLCLGLFYLLVSNSGVALDTPWAHQVVSSSAIDPVIGFTDPSKVLGEPVGGTVYTANNSKMYSLGRPGPDPGSYILLKFNSPIEDHPDNIMGLDCIVYGNAFWVGGNPLRKWVEPAIIEISEDVNGNGEPDDPWYIIPGSRNLSRDVLPQGMPNPTPSLAGNVVNSNTYGTENDWGYAELTPTVQKYLDNFMRPDDPLKTGLTERSGGGDAFDIKWALPVDETGNPEGIARFHFLRLSAFINMIDGAVGDVTPEIGGVATVARDIDSDGDGILDDYEVRVSGTDPQRPESTILALEIPQEYGGSPVGMELGRASDVSGNAITFFSRGTRSGVRNFNCIVDITTGVDPEPGEGITGLVKSAAVRTFSSSESDYESAQIQNAQLSITYESGEIAGLDESEMQPFLYRSGQFTQEGISLITKDLDNNLLSFRSRYSGTFILASVPGVGDISGNSGGVVLHANPARGMAGNPGISVQFTSDIIYLEEDTPVPDGALFNITTTLGAITSEDADEILPGIQIGSSGGFISFSLSSGAIAGTSSISAISLNGTLYGDYDFVVEPGPASGPVEIFPVRADQTAPGPVTFITSQVFDAYNNVLTGAQFLTLAVEGGRPSGKDACAELPGYQVPLTNGSATFSIRVTRDNKYDTAGVFVYLYADAAETALVGSGFFNFEVVQMPLRGHALLAAVLLLSAVLLLRGHRRVPS